MLSLGMRLRFARQELRDTSWEGVSVLRPQRHPASVCPQPYMDMFRCH